MVRLRHAIWRRVLGTLIGSFNDGSIGAVAGILVWGTHMNAAKDRSGHTVRITRQASPE